MAIETRRRAKNPQSRAGCNEGAPDAAPLRPSTMLDCAKLSPCCPFSVALSDLRAGPCGPYGDRGGRRARPSRPFGGPAGPRPCRSGHCAAPARLFVDHPGFTAVCPRLHSLLALTASVTVV